MKKICSGLFALCFVAALLAVPAGTVLSGRKNTTAFWENRTLSRFPSMTAETMLDGSFFQSLETWYSEHIPGRTTLLKKNTAMQMNALRRPVVSDVYVQGDTLLPENSYETHGEAYFRYSADLMGERFRHLNEWVEQCGGSFCFVGFPEQSVYFADRYPEMLESRKEQAAIADRMFYEALEKRGVPYLDMAERYEAAGHPAEYYSLVDHHYTFQGAFAAYQMIMGRLQQEGFRDLPVLGEADMLFSEVPNPYLGSRNRKLYNVWNNPEKAVTGLPKEPVSYTRWDNGELSTKKLFVLPDNDYMPTTYNLYMGGDFGETIITTDRPELPRVLVFGDSFTNALETVMFNSFDETRSLDLRHYGEKSLKDYIEDYRPDLVLCVMNDTFFYTPDGNGNVWEDEA